MANNLDHGHVNPIANSEFTIFTPLSPPHYNNNIFLANQELLVGFKCLLFKKIKQLLFICRQELKMIINMEILMFIHGLVSLTNPLQ